MNVFACAFADVRNATAAAEYAALQRATRQRVTRARVYVCVCVYVFARVREPRASVCANGAGNIADETLAADASPISPWKNLTLPLYDHTPWYARRFEMQIETSSRDVEVPLLSSLPAAHSLRARGKILKTQRGETWKKIRGTRRGDSDPRGNISRITSARFVGEILITFPRHRGGKVCI